jgi:hypothetical protein
MFQIFVHYNVPPFLLLVVPPLSEKASKCLYKPYNRRSPTYTDERPPSTYARTIQNVHRLFNKVSVCSQIREVHCGRIHATNITA